MTDSLFDLWIRLNISWLRLWGVKFYEDSWDLVAELNDG